VGAERSKLVLRGDVSQSSWRQASLASLNQKKGAGREYMTTLSGAHRIAERQNGRIWKMGRTKGSSEAKYKPQHRQQEEATDHSLMIPECPHNTLQKSHSPRTERTAE
jgi:hypothetical protein